MVARYSNFAFCAGAKQGMKDAFGKHTGVSLFSGAGGMDVGFGRAGVNVVWANELDKVAAATYEANHPGTMRAGDIVSYLDTLEEWKGADVVFGGPPCQGFSVAGKMDPNDERSTLLWKFLDVVERVQPRGFVCENVKALGKLEKWSWVRRDFMAAAVRLGYSCSFVILNAAEFGVPQKRERVFFIGSRVAEVDRDDLELRFAAHRKPAPSVRDVLAHLGPAGSPANPDTCSAKVTMAAKPVMRKSPYAGMMFNGLGRPLDLGGASATLPASMGGNKTPIVDEALLHGGATDDWVRSYHKHLMEGGKPLEFQDAPSRLRRLTINEALLLQTFPEDYRFCGGKSSIYKQIGNAVPCRLAEVVARVFLDVVNGVPCPAPKQAVGDLPAQERLLLRSAGLGGN